MFWGDFNTLISFSSKSWRTPSIAQFSLSDFNLPDDLHSKMISSDQLSMKSRSVREKTWDPPQPGFALINARRRIKRRRSNTKRCPLKGAAHSVWVEINTGIMYPCWNICVWIDSVHIWWKCWSNETDLIFKPRAESLKTGTAMDPLCHKMTKPGWI